MKLFSSVLWRAGSVLGMMYFASFGATFNGIMSFPSIRFFTLGLLAVGVIGWLTIHYRNRWAWHATPLDGAFVLWGSAIALSIVANPETWRRSVEGIWYVLLYMLVWYVLADMLSNGIRRDTLLIPLLIVGSVVLIFGGIQIINAWQVGNWGVRPVSMIGNPNALGAFLVVLVPIVLSFLERVQGIGRGILALLGGLASVLLFLTFSRGAWVGLGVAFAVWVILWLDSRHLLNQTALSTWWQNHPVRIKRTLALGAIGVLLVGGAVLFLLFQSFSVGGRQADLRTLLWQYGIQMFVEQPLTGQGFFTYGYHLPRFWSIPAQQPQSHAHNVPINLLAELGIVGAIAFVVSVGGVFRQFRQNWRMASPQHQTLLRGTFAGLIGWGVHHLFDTPAMMPLIALVGVYVLALSAVPLVSLQRPMLARWRVIGHPVGMAVLWSALIGVGIWQSAHYATYYNALYQASFGLVSDWNESILLESVQVLATLSEQDPNQPAYWLQQGYLWGVLASKDPQWAENARLAYEQYVRLEPHSASAWSNLSALYWQLGRPLEAQTAVQQAVTLAPDWAMFQRQYALYHGLATFETNITPPESPYAPNTARYQFLRDVFTSEFIPQVGWAK